MDKTIKTLHLRLDTTSKSLTKNAISQLIIKVLFASNTPLTDKGIESGLKPILKTSIDKNRIDKSIQKLIDAREIKYVKKKYSLTSSNRKTLRKRYDISKQRLVRIVNKYFAPFHSSESDMIEWFSDATIEFFKSYSKEWVYDLSYSKSEKVKTKKEDIFKHIERRTKSNKHINSEDYNEINRKFVDCITNKKDPDLDAHLWEYGTSAFSANLIQSSIGADPISITAFSNSKCLLDTNVLMNIGLEASEYNHAFKKFDVIFKKLNLTPGYLQITRREYIDTIVNINKEIMRNVSKFSYSVIKETDDEFIQSAIKTGCYHQDDFETFCNQISTPPKYIDEEQKITIFNEEPKLDIAIKKAQQDDSKKKELNTLFKNITKHDKKQLPLLHDVGLIAGVEYYRKSEKAFVLSQEISINEYSHTKPQKNNLPLAIRLETLINMLAIDNGGIDVNPNDFSNLFADIIRNNLQPENDTFEIADLSRLLDTELQIEQLPPSEIITIANNVHNNISKGLNDEEVSLALQREFQDVKLKFVSDYTTAIENLSFEKTEKEKHKKEASKIHSALKKRIEKEEFKKFDKEVSKSRVIWYLLIPIGFISIISLGIYLYNNSKQISNFDNYIIGIIVSISIWVLTSFIFTKPRLKRLNEVKKNEIKEKVNKRLIDETK